jgi:hypothetical protein
LPAAEAIRLTRTRTQYVNVLSALKNYKDIQSVEANITGNGPQDALFDLIGGIYASSPACNLEFHANRSRDLTPPKTLHPSPYGRLLSLTNQDGFIGKI